MIKEFEACVQAKELFHKYGISDAKLEVCTCFPTGILGKLIMQCRTAIPHLPRNGAGFAINETLSGELLNNDFDSNLAEASEREGSDTLSSDYIFD